MARTLPIVKVTQSAGPGSPSRITVSGDVTSSFAGKFYRQTTAPFATLPAYSSPTPPAGYDLVAATTFDIVDNPSYNGRYTVYTPTSAGDASPSSTLNSGNTDIFVNEVVGPPVTSGDDFGVGVVANISTYSIEIEGEANLIVPPAVRFSDRPIEVIGRNGSPWAEGFIQNFVKLAQNFASEQAPANPYLGQTWYDVNSNSFNLLTTSGWSTIASGVVGSNTTFRFTQTAPATSWVVPHNLGLISPFVAFTQVFVDTGSGHRMMVPSDIVFDSANQLTVVLSTPMAGVVLIRS